MGIVLRNRSPHLLTVLDARALEPRDSLVRQVGTRLAPWNPKPCPRVFSCPIVGFLTGPYGAAHPVAVAVGPGRMLAAAAQLPLGELRAGGHIVDRSRKSPGV